MANNNKEKIYFFGWHNFKWLTREMSAMYSNRKSYFSKKRFESSIAFLAAMGIIIGHVVINIDTITNSEVLADAALLFAVAGYTVGQIQKEKKDIPGSDATDETPELDSAPKSDSAPKRDKDAKKIITENNDKDNTDYSKDEDAV